jgi:hypothetical protein
MYYHGHPSGAKTLAGKRPRPMAALPSGVFEPASKSVSMTTFPC